MAVLGEIIIEKSDQIKLRSGSVLSDIIIEKEYLQLRTYAMGDELRERGSKQNIQFSKEKAIEFKKILERFISNS